MRSSWVAWSSVVLAGALVSCGGTDVVERQDPEAVLLSAELGNSFVPAGQSQEVIARIRVRGRTLDRTTREPINLALAIDTSGSMDGDPIVHARDATLAILESLREGDRVSVVAFHSATDVLLPSTEIEDGNLDELRERVQAMEARGTTDMAGGLAAALQELMTGYTSEGINRLVLLGDGVPNQEEGILATAQAAGGRGIRIASMGLGLEFNETLMGQIAQVSGGQFHYVEDPEQVATVFREEVLRMQRLVGRNAIVTLTPGPGVQIQSVVGQHVTPGSRAVRVTIGDLPEGEDRDLIVRATVDGHRDGSAVELLDAHLTFDDTLVEAGALDRRAYLGARATESAEELAGGHNPEVERAAVRADAAAVTVEAISMARNGDLANARAALEQNAVRLRLTGERSGSAAIVAEAEEMESLLSSLPSPAAAPEAGAAEPRVQAAVDDEERARRTNRAHDRAMGVLGY